MRGYRSVADARKAFILLLLTWKSTDGFVTIIRPSISVIPITETSSRFGPVPLQHANHRVVGQTRTILCTEGSVDDMDEKPVSIFRKAINKFRARPRTYLIIPFIAALVGWFTNYLAVQMIFYPVGFWGIPIYRKPEVPLGFIGWSGIVPTKTRPMSEAMVNMVTTQLLSVQDVFQRLSPNKVAQLLAPEVPKVINEVMLDVGLPGWVRIAPKAIYDGLSQSYQGLLSSLNRNFLANLVRAMQANIENIFDIGNCVVDQMLQDRSLLGKLFIEVGKKELDFLTNSGLWFGFLLGVIQMIVALFWDNPWSLSIGGLIVGLATNWLALKWIFEPVNPTRVGPFVLQGMFLRRQKEVAAAFSKFFAGEILTSEKVWHSVFADETTRPAFFALFSEHFSAFLKRIAGGLLSYIPEPEVISVATKKAFERLPAHVHVLHKYFDETLGLEDSLRVQMERMSSVQFERVLHPIFEEDELTLIIAGGVLGLAAGLVQQGIETGSLDVGSLFRRFKEFCGTSSSRAKMLATRLLKRIRGKSQR